MKRAIIFLAVGALLLAGRPAVSQDTLVGLGRVHGYASEVFDTSKARYDILVDASRPEDPQVRRYRTIEAAYAAAPEGTRDKPTIIGLMPDVYRLQGVDMVAGLTITKANVTLIGLTDDRRKVVLADNRGNRQGADGNAATVTVDADGFSAINLTFLNYCNVDYVYPGNPAKNLKGKGGAVTQALALRAAGDRHIYSHVALLSRLDTFGNRTTRSYFSHAYLEGTDDFLGQRGPQAVWEDSEFQFNNPGGILFGGGTTFIRSRFRATKYIHVYKAIVAPDAFIDSTLPSGVPLFWHTWRRAPETLNEHSVLFDTRREDGKPVRAADIADSAVGAVRHTVGRDLTEAQARAFNPWNLLRWAPDGHDDGWDPADGRAKYEAWGVLPVRVELTNASPRLRTNEAPVEISAKIYPAGSSKAVHWTTDSPLVKLSSTTGGKITVTAANTTEQTQVVAIRAAADNGLHSTAYVTVDPPYRAPPTLTDEPTLRVQDGQAQVAYTLPLTAKRQDQSLISWFLCVDSTCAQPRRVAVSRGGKPLKALTLTAPMSGLTLMATVEPKHDLSKPGAARRVVAKTPVPAIAQVKGPITLDLTTAPDNTAPNLWDGEWRITGDWQAEPPMDGQPLWGWRIEGEPSGVVYAGRRTGGDLDMTVAFDSDKLEGQTFSMPATSADDARLKSDIVFKYDPDTRSGYAIRLWRTSRSSSATMFQLFKLTNGKGEALPVQQMTGVIKPTTTLRIVVKGSQLNVTGSNTEDGETLSLSAKIEPNRNAGAGLLWGPGKVGGAIVLRKLSVTVGD